MTQTVWSEDVLASLNVLNEQQLVEVLPDVSRGRTPFAAMELRRTRASSLGANGSSTASLSCSDDGISAVSDSNSSGSLTPPTRCISITHTMMQARRSPVVNRRQHEKVKAALRARMQEEQEQHDAIREEAAQDSKPAAVTAAIVTFMMAMLSCPLGPCLPATHIHLSRLPIGTGHSEVIDALRREWPGHDFSIKLHVYQKTRHVSGVASITPGLIPEEMDSLRSRTDNIFLPLVSGDKIIVEESKRDSDPHLCERYKSMVLQGLGHHVEGAPPLLKTVQEHIESPIVYLRVMADRSPSNGLLLHVSDIRQEGLVAILDRYPTPGQSLSESVLLIAPDKSANRQHMHRSHFGRAYFLECTDNESAERLMKEIQKDSVQTINGMSFSLHVEMKKGAINEMGEPGRLFEQDAQKRQQVERRLEKCKRNIENLQNDMCGCGLPELHTMAVHSLFIFKGRHCSVQGSGSDNSFSETTSCKDTTCPSTYLESACCDSIAGDIPDTASMTGTEFTEASEFESHQPYDSGYGFAGAQQQLQQQLQQQQLQQHLMQQEQEYFDAMQVQQIQEEGSTFGTDEVAMAAFEAGVWQQQQGWEQESWHSGQQDMRFNHGKWPAHPNHDEWDMHSSSTGGWYPHTGKVATPRRFPNAVVRRGGDKRGHNPRARRYY